MNTLSGATDDLVAEDLDAFDLDRIEAVASSLDLRQPNKEALESIVFEVVQHYEIDRRPPPFEAVVDAATGVGKTFILAAAIEYFAGQGIRDFAVIVPGRTILEKTVANFTPGDPKSLLTGMSVRPVIITSENFNTAAMREAIDDEQQVKLYVFTVQSLLKPQTKAGRKTHKFQEGLGAAFYEHLQSHRNLFVFADEHHAYYGPAFSQAVRNLNPRVLVGLTATPHRNTPEDRIIYRYPLAAAIADKLVKTPVLVGRRDDRAEPETKLADGVALLELKGEAIERFCSATGAEPVQPVMLVIAADIAEAEEIDGILQSQEFAGGRYVDKVLTVHSRQSDEALAQLAKLEEPGSPHRIVVSVGMLKEGWDVKSVYVICSLRASVSDLLTEQTLGRGLRLPFGSYTNIEILDSLEVLAHERYEQLLKKAGVINEQFVDRRTRAVLRKNALGELASTVETTEISSPFLPEAAGLSGSGDGQAIVARVDEQEVHGKEELEALAVELAPRSAMPVLRIPRLKMTPLESDFSLADITDFTPFRDLGNRISTNPEDELRRTKISAKIVSGADGLRHTELVTAPAVDRVSSQGALHSLNELRTDLLERLLMSAVVPARKKERNAAVPIVDAFIAGLGEEAERILSAFFDRAAGSLVAQVAAEQRKLAPKPKYEEVVEVSEFRPMRMSRPHKSENRRGPFKRGLGYNFAKSFYAEDWFDSSPERETANLLDESDEISYFVRLQRGDLPVLWAEGRNYNPDFIVVEITADHYVVEVKADSAMQSDMVQEKRKAARRWANHVSADDQVDHKWSYLLVSESDVKMAKDSWSALKRLAI